MDRRGRGAPTLEGMDMSAASAPVANATVLEELRVLERELQDSL